jgi:hypothetical protein
MLILLYAFIFKHSTFGANDLSLLPWFFAGMFEFAVIELPLLYYFIIVRTGKGKSATQGELNRLEGVPIRKRKHKK